MARFDRQSELVRSAIARSGKTLDAIAIEMNVTEGTIRHWRDGTNGVPIERIGELCYALGDNSLLNEILSPVGKACVDVPCADACSSDNIQIMLARMAAENGDVAREVMKAISPDSDGGTDITVNEWRRLRGEAIDVAAAAVVLVAVCDERIKEDDR